METNEPEQLTFMYGRYDDDSMVSIPLTLYDDLQERNEFLNALEAAGVDNWDGYDFAQEIFEAFHKEK